MKFIRIQLVKLTICGQILKMEAVMDRVVDTQLKLCNTS